jgi:flagellar L-ring protein precursor FlgH
MLANAAGAQTSTPQTPASAGQATPAAKPTSTAPAGRQSWVSDRRDFQVGDIVTIQVDEYTLTSLDKRVDATDNRHRDMDLALSTPTASQKAGIGSNNNSSSQTRGTDARNNRLVTEMSARIVEIGPNRTMRLEGTKSLHVEKSIINITLSGWTRAQDIGPSNVISSARLADAKLDYEAKGPLGSPKGGLLGRLLGKLWL